MAKSQVTDIVKRPFVREGEGFALDVARHQLDVSGASVVEIQIDVAKAPVPERKYVADYVAVDERRGVYRLMFGQERVDGSGKLRSLIVIHLTMQGMWQFVRSLETIRGPKYEEILKTLGLVAASTLDKPKEEPSQAVAMSANVILTGMAGDDATMDFYRASPFSVRSVENGGKFYIDPVVRVDMPGTLFVALARDLQARAPKDSLEAGST